MGKLIGDNLLPGNVKIDLPQAVKVLRKAGIDVPMMVTEIISTDNSLDIETILLWKAGNQVKQAEGTF
ncbi:MAG: hypothetical protein V2B15_06175 [Bacteroidota bacterium]